MPRRKQQKALPSIQEDEELETAENNTDESSVSKRGSELLTDMDKQGTPFMASQLMSESICGRVPRLLPFM
jgi:hypothetical protein